MYEQPSKQHTDSRPFFVRCLNHSQGKPRTPSQKLERTIKLYFKFEFRRPGLYHHILLAAKYIHSFQNSMARRTKESQQKTFSIYFISTPDPVICRIKLKKN
ncbi:hypothetical protein OIU74_029828 [Salix koriyanagi]|uniref:Uncharacterized protein n=1 Tax=Salix koriyanagi TaxID=2511006 RepID=A0A9Q0ZUS0_9ROSI|nr:hypothetical protein OIU74_029828 [Salix koriyanagi]